MTPADGYRAAPLPSVFVAPICILAVIRTEAGRRQSIKIFFKNTSSFWLCLPCPETFFDAGVKLYIRRLSPSSNETPDPPAELFIFAQLSLDKG